MISYLELNNEISSYVAHEKDLNELKEKYETQVKKLHAFMDMFLKKFGSKVMGDKDKSPEWKLFSSKTEEYNVYTRAIRNVDYFISKASLAQR